MWSRTIKGRFVIAVFFLVDISTVTDATVTGAQCRILSQSHVDCSHRGLSVIPNQTFPETLKWLDLSFNNIPGIEGFTFHNLKDLEWLNLSQNDIIAFSKNAFFNLNKLRYLNLNSNSFIFVESTFPSSLFQPLQSLEILHIEDNICRQKGSYVYPMGITLLTNLRELHTDIPPFVRFPETIFNMTNLEVLSSSGSSVPHKKNQGCCIKGLYNNSFPYHHVLNIKHFRLSHSCIDNIHTDALRPFQNLDKFEWIGNQRLGLYEILQALYSLRNTNISHISLRENNDFFASQKTKGFYVDPYEVRYLRTICAKYLDISQNYLIFHTKHVLHLSRPDCLTVLDFSGHSTEVPHLLKAFIKLRSFPNVRLLNISNYIGPTNQLTAPQEHSNKNRTLLPLVNIDLSYLPMKCAFYSKQFSTVHVLNITGWNCSRIQSEVFVNMRNVTSLTMRKVSLSHNLARRYQKGSIFRNLESLELLDLSGNALTYLTNNLLLNNHRLKTLILSDNKLASLPTFVFQQTKLELLDMSSNVVRWFTHEEINILNNQKEKIPNFKILMNSNLLICSCDSVEFLQWLNSTNIVADLDNDLTCRYQNGTEVAILDFLKDFKDFSVGCVSESWLKWSIAAILIFLPFLIGCVVYYRRRWNIHYWFYTSCKPTEEMLPKREYIYDAFIAYNHTDSGWVYNSLRNTLEEQTGLKLCLHHRDFEAGEVIQQNIVDSINSSRKTILVISQQFIRSTWGEYEIQMAAMRSVQEARSNVIVCVLLEEIPIKEMPKSLMNLWNNVTFLVWSDNPLEQNLFWEKMTNALK